MDEDDLAFMDAVLFEDEMNQPQHHQKHHQDQHHFPSGPFIGTAVDSDTGWHDVPPPPETDDPVGSLIARSLNTPGSAFLHGGSAIGAAEPPPPLLKSNPEGTDLYRDHDKGDIKRRFRPLLSRDNVRFAWAASVWFFVSLCQRGPRYVSQELHDRSLALFLRPPPSYRRRKMPTWRETAVSSAAVALLSVALLAVPGHFSVLLSLRAGVTCALASITLLFDPEEISSACPGAVCAAGRVLLAAWRCVEGTLLLRDRYEGRADWGEGCAAGDIDAGVRGGGGDDGNPCTRFGWRHQGLVRRWRGRFGGRWEKKELKLADIEALFMTLESDRVKVESERGLSYDTGEHVVAMNFCYTMLRGIQKDKSGREKQRKKPKDEGLNIIGMRTKGNSIASLAHLGRNEQTGHVRQRTSSWPHFCEPGQLFPDKESVEVVMKGEGNQSKSLIEDSLPEKKENKWIVHQRSDKKGYDSNDNVNNRRRLNSDSKVKYQLEDDDDSTVMSPLITRVSLDDLDISTTSSVLSSPALTESRRRLSRNSSIGSFDSKVKKELDWLDVGTKIGIRLLNSEKVQKVIQNPSESDIFLGELGLGELGKKMQLNKIPGKKTPSISTHQGPIELHNSPPGVDIAAYNLSPLDGAASTEERWSWGQQISPSEKDDSMKAHIFPERNTPVPKPVHAIWTTPGAAVSPHLDSPSSVNSSHLSRNDFLHFQKVEEEYADSTVDASLVSSCRRRLPEEIPSLSSDKELGQKNGKKKNCMKDLKPPILLNSRYLLPTSMALTNTYAVDSTAKGRCLPSIRPIDKKRFSKQLPFRSSDAPLLAVTLQRQQSESSTLEQRPPSVRVPKIAIPPQTKGIKPKRRQKIAPGVKMVVPLCPILPSSVAQHTSHHNGRKLRRVAHMSGCCHYQMATVVSSKRIHVPLTGEMPLVGHNLSLKGVSLSASATIEGQAMEVMLQEHSNCLSITVHLDQSHLRDCKFAGMTLRVMDEWGQQYMPRHSKFPIGSCLATSFGIGILVGWRVEDDCHVIRSLWRRRGAGSGLAYLNRDALHGVLEAAIGFEAETRHGKGKVLGYINGGVDFQRGTYFVRITDLGPQHGHLIQCNRSEIQSCRAAKFIPVIEQIKESAKYQIQVDNYELLLQLHSLDNKGEGVRDAEIIWNKWSEGLELILSSFMRAVEEDADVNTWLSSFITFLDSLDFNGNLSQKKKVLNVPNSCHPQIEDDMSRDPTGMDKKYATKAARTSEETTVPVLWFIDDLFGGVFKAGRGGDDDVSDISSVTTDSSGISHTKVTPAKHSNDSYATAFSFLRTILRTLAIARASVPERPNLQMGLSMCHELILFIRTVIKVQQKNISQKSLQAWKRLFEDIGGTFGPLKKRLEKLAIGVKNRMEEQGKIAKIRLLRFIDIVVMDDRFLTSLELGAWDQCIARLEVAVVKAGIFDRKACMQYRKTAEFICSTLAPRASNNRAAAARSEKKLAHFAMALKWMASPQRSFLSLFTHNFVLDVIEHLMVRVYQKDSDASTMLNICAFNFHSFRHLRIFNNMAIAGKLWKPLIDAADEEFAWAVSRMPENAKEYVEPFSKLFSLGVAKFHQINSNDLTSDWLDFLTEDEAVKIIQKLDLKLILNLEVFCCDLKEAMVVLPYYSR